MPWVPDGTNCLTSVEDDVRDMLCATSQFYEWVGVAGPSQAKPYVFAHTLPSQRDNLRWPEDSEVLSDDFWAKLRNYAIVSTAPENGFIYRHVAAPGEFLTAGVIELQLVRFFEEDETEYDLLTRKALNEQLGIVEAMLPLSNTAGYPMVTEVELLAMDWDPEDQVPETGNQFRAVVDISWTMGDDA